MTKLAAFEGKETLSAGVEIRNAAGGLNEALNVDAAEWHQGDEVTVTLRCTVDKVRFDPIKDTGGNRRVHILTATSAAVIEDDLVAEILDEQAERIQRAKEAAEGVSRLPTEEELVRQHELGEHAEGLVEGCPSCDEKAEAEEREASGS